MTEAAAKRARNGILVALDAQKTNQHGGWVTGRFLADIVGQPLTQAQAPLSDDNVLGLCRDLVAAGYLVEEDNREDRSQPFGLDYLTFKATDKGLGFVRRSEPADADIDDGRIVRR
ncbi:MAG: hypothetical protein AAF333_13280 [Planctomycetota bacterium]